MKDSEGRLERRIAQVLIKLGKLPRRQETFVNDRPRGKRTNIASRRQECFGALPHKSQTPLEAGCSTLRVEGLDEKLPNFRLGFEGAAAQGVGVDWNAAPSEHAEPFGISCSLDCRLGFFGLRGGEKREAYPKYFGEYDSLLRRSCSEKRLWQGGQEPRAVSADAIRVDPAAVRETLQGDQSKLDNVVTGGSAKTGDEAGATGIVVGVTPVGAPPPS